MPQRAAPAGAARPPLALDAGAKEHGLGPLSLRRRPSGLRLESVGDPLNNSERSTAVPEEDQAVAPECPEGIVWGGETPTASMSTAMLEQMMKCKAAGREPVPITWVDVNEGDDDTGLLQPPGMRPAEESVAPPAPAGPHAPRGETVMLQIPLEVAGAHPLAAGDARGVEVSLLETRLEDGCMVINLRVDVGAGGSVAFDPSLAPGPLAPAPAVLAERRLGSLTAVPRSRRSTPRAEESCSMVCCHWKNKGFCKYGNSCKFRHPEHKRGVGLPSGAGPRAAGLAGSAAQAQRPGGPPAGVGSCPLPGAARPAFAVAASGRYS